MIHILENKDIFTFCKFRTTNTKLPIETGRWNNIARENRILVKNDLGDVISHKRSPTQY
jgi:hypothetical protein